MLKNFSYFVTILFLLFYTEYPMNIPYILNKSEIYNAICAEFLISMESLPTAPTLTSLEDLLSHVVLEIPGRNETFII